MRGHRRWSLRAWHQAKLDWFDIVSGVFLALTIGVALAPLIVGYKLGARLGLTLDMPRTPDAISRKLGGESRVEKRERLQREIEEGDRELGLNR